MSVEADASLLSSSPSAGDLLTGRQVASHIQLPSESSCTEEDASGSKGDDVSIFTKLFIISQAAEVETYKMNLPQRGYAIIVNNENFHPSTSMHPV